MLKIVLWLLLAMNGVLFALGQGSSGKNAVQRTEPQRLAEQLHPEQLILAQPAASAAAVPVTPELAVAPAPVVAPPVAAPDKPAVSVPLVASAPVTVASPTPASTPLPVTTPAPAPAAVPAAKPAPAPAPAPVSIPKPVPAVVVAPPAPAERLLACVDVGNFDPNEAKSFRSRLAAAKLNAQPTQRTVQEVASYMVFIAAEDGREGAERRAAELRRLGVADFYILPESSPRRDAISLGLFKTEAAAKAYIGQLIPRGVRSARIAERTASANKVTFRLHDLNNADQARLATLVAAFPNQSRRDCGE